jgi:hypothetical protein
MRHEIEILLHGRENTAILSQGESPRKRSDTLFQPSDLDRLAFSIFETVELVMQHFEVKIGVFGKNRHGVVYITVGLVYERLAIRLVHECLGKLSHHHRGWLGIRGHEENENCFPHQIAPSVCMLLRTLLDRNELSILVSRIAGPLEGHSKGPV